MSEEAVKEAVKKAKEVDTPVAEQEVKAPVAKQKAKAPAAKREAKAPAAKQEAKAPAAKQKAKAPSAKQEAKAPAAEQKEAAKVAESAESGDAEDKKAPEAAADTKPPKSEAASIMNANEEEADKATETARKKGRGKSMPSGIAFVRATFNNTIVSIADARGGVISWSSAGKAGFKGSRKSTAFAATMVAQDAARQAISKGMHEVEVRIQGAGAGRESAVRAIQQAGISVSCIKDYTPIPHNGCRPRKRRRV